MKNKYNDVLIFIIGVTLTLVFGGIVFSSLQFVICRTTDATITE
jgi:hypothetical protein